MASCYDLSAKPEETQITAKEKLNDVKNFALKYSSHLKLIAVNSFEVNQSGRADRWNYKFYSKKTDSTYLFYATPKGVFLDTLKSPIIDGFAVINSNWFDSEEALRIAEMNGGKVFRESNPNVTIDASLVSYMVGGGN